MREIVLDTETTGLNYKSGDRVIEVGCVELMNHVSTDNNLHFYCSTNKSIESGAIKVHGLTSEFLSKHPTFEDQAKKFIDFIRNDTLIIHNADFDVGFINNELNLIGRDKLKNKVIDTVSLARKTLNTRIANLDYLCRRFSINLEERKLHGALLDSQLLAEVYLELIGGKQITMSLDAIEKKEVISIKNNNENPHLSPSVLLTKEETSEHKRLIKEIKNSLWEKMYY